MAADQTFGRSYWGRKREDLAGTEEDMDHDSLLMLPSRRLLSQSSTTAVDIEPRSPVKAAKSRENRHQKRRDHGESADKNIELKSIDHITNRISK